MRVLRVASWATAAFAAFSLPSGARAQSFSCREVMIPARDGVRLAADLYLPTQGQPPFPTIVERTPYNKGSCRSEVGQYYSRRGYAVVLADERGRYNSEGLYYWWIQHGWGKIQDGYDTIEWAGTQPWSSGKVGTMGLSMGCFNQYMAAPTRPPHLAAMFCTQAAGNPYKDLFYEGGALHLIMPTWLLTRDEMARPFRLHYGSSGGGYVGTLGSWREWYDRKQQRGQGMAQSFISDPMTDLVAHPTYDDYWKSLAMDEHVAEVDVPIFHYGGWYDRYPLSQMQLFNALDKQGGPKARGNQRLLYGPWTHGAGQGVASRVIGDVDFGPEAAIDADLLRLRWFDHWLKGIDNGIMKEPPVKIFVMGANRWRFEKEFPLSRAVERTWYFRTGNSGTVESLNDGRLLSETPRAESPDPYSYDPKDPVPTIGGDLFIEPSGARDHRPADRLSLTYTTDPLADDTEITGVPRVELFASSSAFDTDWVVTISDVRADGYAQVLRQNLLRASFRGGFEKRILLKPDSVYSYTIGMYPISNVFMKGHRIRITVTSSSFPKWYPNGNTGKPMDEEGPGVVATNTVFHDVGRASRVVLPIVPAGSSPAWAPR